MSHTAELITRLRKLNERLYGGIETDLEEAASHIEALQTENARIGIDAAKEIVKLRSELKRKAQYGKEWMDKYLDRCERLTAQGSQIEKLQGENYEMACAEIAAGAAPKLSKFKLLAITTAYEQGVGKGKQGTDFNPYSEGIDEHEAWRLGYHEGEGMAAPTAPTKEPMLLGDDEIESINDSMCGEREFAVQFARAILAAAKENKNAN